MTESQEWRPVHRPTEAPDGICWLCGYATHDLAQRMIADAARTVGAGDDDDYMRRPDVANAAAHVILAQLARTEVRVDELGDVAGAVGALMAAVGHHAFANGERAERQRGQAAAVHAFFDSLVERFGTGRFEFVLAGRGEPIPTPVRVPGDRPVH